MPTETRSGRGVVGVLVALCVSIVGSCRPTGEETGARVETSASRVAPWFEEVGETIGVDFVHIRATRERHWFPEIMSGGGAWLDYDNDGDLDLYLVQGGEIDPRADVKPINRLYRNEGQTQFVDVTPTAGVGDDGYGMGVAVGDFDGDGNLDLYVTNLGHNVLFRNRGDGSFSHEAQAGVGDEGWGTSAAFLDFDRDGDLDLYVVNYVNWSPEIEVDCFGIGGARDYCHPNRYVAPAADTLFRNNGDRSFTDVSEVAGIRAAFGNGLGVAVTDFDLDGRTDILVANDSMPNQLWINQGGGRFVDQAVERGCAVNLSGAAEAGMGIALADVDGDGRSDFLLTHLRRETNTLYVNNNGLCDDETAIFGLAAPSISKTGFGTGLADFDLDGRLDLWVSNGRVTRGTPLDPDDPFAEPNQLFRGVAPNRFEELDAESSGVGLLIENSRATAFGDYDSDGGVDVLVVNNGGRARVFRNRLGSKGSWVQLRLQPRPQSTVMGTRVRTQAGGSARWGEWTPSYSYCASNDPNIHFGLGEAEELDEVYIDWSGGREQTFRKLPARRVLVFPQTG